MSVPDPDDLTARARIRDAALAHFGEHGFERSTIRGIAETAGVSSGLVRHHFGSKQALREACDAYLAARIRGLDEQVRADTAPGEVNYVAVARAALGSHQRYLARALAEGSAGFVFDEMVRMSEQWLSQSDPDRPDPPDVSGRARATVGTAMALAVSVLHTHVSRGLGVDVFSPEGDELLARVLLDLYAHPVLSPAQAAEIRAGLDRGPDPQTLAERISALHRSEDDHDD